jgi:hypothetical protein
MNLDAAAAAFARRHGSFALIFDADEIPGGREPVPLPWAVMLDSDVTKAWGGLTAEEALANAEAALDSPGQPG